jgi:hypothetical protein
VLPHRVADLVADELRSWRGVRVLEIDDLNERVIIEIDDDATAHPDDLLESVRDLGATNATRWESQPGPADPSRPVARRHHPSKP